MLSLPLVRTIKRDVCQIYKSPLCVSVCVPVLSCEFYSKQMRASAIAVKAINTCLEVFVCGYVWFSATAVVVCCILCSHLTHLIWNMHVYIVSVGFCFHLGNDCFNLLCLQWHMCRCQHNNCISKHWHSTLFYMLHLHASHAVQSVLIAFSFYHILQFYKCQYLYVLTLM